MKKTLSMLLTFVLCAGVLAGCGSSEAPSSAPEQSSQSEASETSSEASEPASSEESSEPESSEPATSDAAAIRVSALKGPTAMGMVKLMQDAEDGTTQNNYEFTIATTDEIVPLISKGELDIAAVPANLASVLYNNTEGKVKVLAINTLGVLYVVEKGETIQSVADLAGKTVYSTGKGATPEFALNHVLTQNGIDPATGLTIEYKSEAAEIIPLLAQGENGIAIVPQPFVTTALAKVEGLRVALDWTEQWDSISTDGSSMVTGVVVVNSAFAEENPDAVKTFMAEYAASTAYTETNTSEAALLVEKYGIVDAAIAEKAIPACNITYIDGADMKEKLSGYLNVLVQQNPQSVGGALPDDAFYYIP